MIISKNQKIKRKNRKVSHIKISFLGLGVVGSKLMEYIRGNLNEVKAQTGEQLYIDKVFIRDITKRRAVSISDLVLTKNYVEATKDADIIIDCMGGSGADLTREMVIDSIKKKKSVIMSSKKCLALYGKEICDAVLQNNTILHYDATVGGCIPISSVLEHMGKCERINKIYGICNATSNYIMDEMQHNRCSYQAALQRAEKIGYAENNPEEDTDGFDALYKSVIMTGFGMGYWMDCSWLKPISIRSITATDIQEAQRSKCVLKPLFSVENVGDRFSFLIGPKAVPYDSILASVKGNNNIIIVSGSESGERAFYGQGAGAKPTASAMFDDLIKTIKQMK